MWEEQRSGISCSETMEGELFVIGELPVESEHMIFQSTAEDTVKFHYSFSDSYEVCLIPIP